MTEVIAKKKQDFFILCIFSNMTNNQRRKISNSFNRLGMDYDYPEFYRFKVMSSPGVPSEEEVALADFIFCDGDQFINNHEAIKKVVAKNQNVWFGTLSIRKGYYENSKECGCKHRLLFQDLIVDEDIIYHSFIHNRICSYNPEIISGSGFNNGEAAKIELNTKAEITFEGGFPIIPIKIIGNSEGIFVNGTKVKSVMFNNIQLRFSFEKKRKHIIFDHTCAPDFTIAEIYNKITPFLYV